MTLAIASASGGYRVAFVQGALSALERAGIRADAYAGASGSVIPAALAAMGCHEAHGLAYIKGLLANKSLGQGMSGAFLTSIAAWSPLICEALRQHRRARLVVPVSAVVTAEAADTTQGRSCSHLGRRLLLEAARHQDAWVRAHLRLELFDTDADEAALRLTADNFADVAYASSRMLHAWDVPAWIAGRPFIDASYTCSCPALELAQQGYEEIVAITPECGPFVHDLFAAKAVPPSWEGTPIRLIQPDVDLTELGVQCTQASEDGLLMAYRHGEAKGYEFLAAWTPVVTLTDRARE